MPGGDFVYTTFLIFCRIGGCIMIAPGFSSDRVPMQSRLYLAAAIAFALTPPLMEQFHQALAGGGYIRPLLGVITEVAIGVVLGLLARLYFLALETLATSVSMTFGLGNIFSAAVVEAEPTPAFSSFILIAAVTLLFCADLHLEIIRGLYQSYEIAPPWPPPRPTRFLERSPAFSRSRTCSRSGFAVHFSFLALSLTWRWACSHD